MLILKFEVLEAGGFLGIEGKFTLSFEFFDLFFLLVFLREESQEIFVVSRNFSFGMSFFSLLAGTFWIGIDTGVESLSVTFLIDTVSFVGCWGVVVITWLDRLLLRRSVNGICIFFWVFVKLYFL